MKAGSGAEAELLTISEENLSIIVSIRKHQEDLFPVANSITMVLKDGSKKHELYEKSMI